MNFSKMDQESRVHFTASASSVPNKDIWYFNDGFKWLCYMILIILVKYLNIVDSCNNYLLHFQYDWYPESDPPAPDSWTSTTASLLILINPSRSQRSFPSKLIWSNVHFKLLRMSSAPLALATNLDRRHVDFKIYVINVSIVSASVICDDSSQSNKLVVAHSKSIGIWSNLLQDVPRKIKSCASRSGSCSGALV